MVIDIRQLAAGDAPVLAAMMGMFREVFQEPDPSTPLPGRDYLERLLMSETFLAVAALVGVEVVGGLTAYELRKPEREASEIYLYDLAVVASHRRRGIATGLIERLRQLAAQRGACEIFVQADKEIEDQPAIVLYEGLGTCRDVFHFEIAVPPPNPARVGSGTA